MRWRQCLEEAGGPERGGIHSQLRQVATLLDISVNDSCCLPALSTQGHDGDLE